MNYKGITIRKGGEEIETHTYILTFNKLVISKEMKIGYCLGKVELDILVLLSYFKYQVWKPRRATQDMWKV